MGWTRIGSLGKGSYGFVSLGQSTSPSDGIGPKLPTLFAIKSAPHTDSKTLEFERGLFHELRDCPEIIGCYGADASMEDSVVLYNLFLEYASGGCLKDRIYSGKPMSEDEIKNYTRSILLGLRHIHRKGIIHCDVKPANVLLVYGGNGSYVAKISDLGLALLEEDETDVEKLRGTPRYLAPESILHGDYGPGVDIWALGCVVAEMILRRPLRQLNRNSEMTLETMLERMAKQEVEIPAGISADAHSFLTKCLDVNPISRWGADKLLREHPFVSDSDSDSIEYDLELAFSNSGEDFDEIDFGFGDDFGETDFGEDFDETGFEAATDLDASYTEEDLRLILPMKLLKRDRDEDALSDDQYPAFCKKRRLFSPCC